MPRKDKDDLHENCEVPLQGLTAEQQLEAMIALSQMNSPHDYSIGFAQALDPTIPGGHVEKVERERLRQEAIKNAPSDIGQGPGATGGRGFDF